MNIMDHIVLLLSCVADIFICYDFFKGFFTLRSRNSTNRLFIVSVGFVMILYGVNLIGSVTLNLLFTPIVVLVYLMTVFYGRIVSKLMYFLLTMSVMLGSEFIFVVLVGMTNSANNINLSDFPFSVFGAKLIGFLILLFIRQFAENKRQRMVNKVFWRYLLIPISSLGMMFAAFHVGQEALENPEMKLMLTLSFALMLFANIMVFAAFQSYSEELAESMRKEFLISKEKANKQYYDKISEINEERKALNHDLKHYFSGLRGLILSGDKEKAVEYLTRIDSRLDSNEMILFSRIPLLDAILTEKKNCAEAADVEFNVHVEQVSSLQNISESEYMAMLGNLLDNAIRAAESCRGHRFVTVNIYEVNQGTHLISKIENSYQEDDIKQHNGKLVTTKKNVMDHGLGLKNVKKLAGMQGGTFVTDRQDGIFTASIMLPLQ